MSIPQDDPPGYKPPRSVKELVERYQAGERNFGKADLTGQDLSKLNLSGTNFSKAKFKGAKLCGINLSHSQLFGADLSDADLSSIGVFNWTYPHIHIDALDKSSGKAITNLSNSSLEYANLSRAKLFYADLKFARLDLANLMGASLVKANLEGAELREASLENADLRGAWALQLDNNFIKGAQFSPDSKDQWSVLRRRYTGPRFILSLLFLSIFILPYVGKAAFWIGINKGQSVIISTRNDLEKAVTQTPVEGNGEKVEQVSGVIKKLSPCLSQNCQERPVWQLLLGIDNGWPYWALSSALFLYNVCRGVLTVRVAPLREEEERSDYSPAWNSYSWLWILHLGVSSLFYVSAAAFLWHAYHWLTKPVWLPM